jgi:hypothetical protein
MSGLAKKWGDASMRAGGICPPRFFICPPHAGPVILLIRLFTKLVTSSLKFSDILTIIYASCYLYEEGNGPSPNRPRASTARRPTRRPTA